MRRGSDERHLKYIRDSIVIIERRTSGGKDEFLQDIDIQDAVLWRLETLAEATGKLSQTVKQRHPEVRWRAIYGFRNIAAHSYLDLHLDLVWEIIELHLSPLLIVVDKELSQLSADGGEG